MSGSGGGSSPVSSTPEVLPPSNSVSPPFGSLMLSRPESRRSSRTTVWIPYSGTLPLRIWSNSGCEPTVKSGTAVRGIIHANFSALVSGSYEI
jgi:hypothetical protein